MNALFSNSDELKNNYKNRINRVMDYIEAHLDENLTLERLADIACFSKFHFHRMFQASTGERLAAYIQRIRLEKRRLYLAAILPVRSPRLRFAAALLPLHPLPTLLKDISEKPPLITKKTGILFQVSVIFTCPLKIWQHWIFA